MTRKPIQLALALTQFLVLIALGWLTMQQLESRSSRRPPNGPGQAVSSDELRSVPELRLPGLPSYVETTRRPLFFASRRPPTTGNNSQRTVTEQPQALEIRDYVLAATVVVGKDKEALLIDTRTGKSVLKREGETLGGWTLATIHPNRVVLYGEDFIEEVVLHNFDREAVEHDEDGVLVDQP